METPHGSSVCCFSVLGLLSRWFFIFFLFPFTTEKKTKKQKKKRRPLSQGDRHQPYFFTSRKIPPSLFFLLFFSFFLFSTGKKHTNTPLSLAATLYMILIPILSVKLGTGGKVVSLPLRVHVFLYFLGAASGQLGIAGAGYADTKNKKKRPNFMINFHIFTISSLYDRRKEKNIKYSEIGPSCSCSFSRSCWGRGRGRGERGERGTDRNRELLGQPLGDDWWWNQQWNARGCFTQGEIGLVTCVPVHPSIIAPIRSDQRRRRFFVTQRSVDIFRTLLNRERLQLARYAPGLRTLPLTSDLLLRTGQTNGRQRSLPRCKAWAPSRGLCSIANRGGTA
ncbi:hypothetical protein LY78DRAFT_388442 [Colletotrichum sublineola]|nr:hypothetical protein LY78DRAFT_388442 [Colletotrichum sublineola]